MKTNITRIALASAILCCLMLCASCSSKKSTPKQSYESSAEQAKKEKDPLAVAFASLASSYKPWTDVSMPVKLELKEPKRFSVSGKASMVYGKSVYMSLRLLGMELGAIYVDTDSIYIMSKMQRMAYVESLDYFSKNFGFTLEDIQSLLLGQAFVPGKGALTLAAQKDFKLRNGEKTGELILSPAKTPRNVSWHFKGQYTQEEEGIAAIINALIVQPATMQPLSALFSGQCETSGGTVASEVSMSATMSKKSLKVNVIWSLNRAEWNKGIAPSAPKIPSNYTRLTTKGLTELLKKL